MLAKRVEPLTHPKPWEGEEFVPETILQPVPQVRRAQTDPFLGRWGLILVAVLTVGILVIVPVVQCILPEAFGGKVFTYFHSLLGDPDTRHAIFLTLVVTPVRGGFECSVWASLQPGSVARFRFPRPSDPHNADRSALFSIARRRRAGVRTPLWLARIIWRSWLRDHGYQVLFTPLRAAPGHSLCDDPICGSRTRSGAGSHRSEEGPGGSQPGSEPAGRVFWRVTLAQHTLGPDLWRHSVQCSRYMGEFGARLCGVRPLITGQTDTMPLRVEKLFQEYNSPAAFAVASVLTVLALVTLAAQGGRSKRRSPSRQSPPIHSERSRGEA